jgi:hypothetical protein
VVELNTGKTGTSMRIVYINRKPRKCDCKKCTYYHSGEEGKEYCSMNRKRLFPRKCSNYNRKIDGMVLYRQKQNRKKKRKNKNKQKKRNI